MNTVLNPQEHVGKKHINSNWMALQIASEELAH